MKNLFVLLLGLLLVTWQLLAQQISFSRPQRVSRQTEEFRIVGKNSQGILIHQYGTRQNSLIAYQSDLDIAWSKPIALEKKHEIVRVVSLDEDLMILYTEKVKRKNYLYARMANAEMIWAAPPVLLDSVLRDPTLSYTYEVDVSQNKSFVNIMRTNYDFGGLRDMDNILLRKDGSMVSHEIVKPDTKQLNSNVVVSNMGQVILVSYQTRRDFFRTNTQYRSVYITVLDPLRQRTERFLIEDEKYRFNEAKFALDYLNNRFVVAGFYAQGTNETALGWFYSTLDLATFSLSKPILSSFDLDYFKKNNLKSNAFNKTGIADLSARQVVLRRDGGVLLVGEVSYTTRQTIAQNGFDMSGRTIGFSVNYYNEDVFSFSIQPDGSLLWANIVQKKQYSEDDDAIYSSFGLMNRRHSIDLLFNQEINYNTPVVGGAVSSSGSYKMVNLMSKQDLGILLSLRNGKQVSAEEYVVPSFTRRGDFMLAKINF